MLATVVGMTAMSFIENTDRAVEERRPQAIYRVDLDHDGDLDLVVENGLSRRTVFINIDGKYERADQFYEEVKDREFR